MKAVLGVVAACCLVLGMVSPVFSAGFALIEQGVKGLGNAFAGGAAVAEDATTVFFNPAGLARMEGQQMVVGLHYIAPSAEFENEGSTHVAQPMTGVPLLGDDDGDSGEPGFVPNFYYGVNWGGPLSFGLGINAPFGLATEYKNDWVGRYHAIRSELKTVNINPSIAIRFNDFLSLGLGFNVQYLEAELSNAIDFGTMTGNPLAFQKMDGLLELEGDSWDYGYNVGLLMEFTENSRLGLAYRSAITHDVEGDADFSDVPAAFGGDTGPFRDTDVTASASLPDTASASYYQGLGSSVAIMADVTWTGWNSFDELRFKFESGLPDGVTTESWEDSWRYAVGMTFDLSGATTLRTGVAYDETPIPSAEFRTPRIPCADRLWVTLGLGHRISEALEIDFAYAYLTVDDPEIDKDPVGEDALRGGLKGSYDDADVNIASVQLSYNF